MWGLCCQPHLGKGHRDPSGTQVKCRTGKWTHGVKGTAQRLTGAIGDI